MEYIQNLGDERQMTFCVHCGGKAETRDHIPSRFLLDEPYPSQLPTVPACRACNETLSKDEVYFACLVECARVGSVTEKAIQREKIRRILKECPALAARLAQAQKEIGNGISFDVEYERVKKVVLKLCRGHVAFELNEPQYHEPDTFSVIPITSMPEDVYRYFETPPHSSVWPEVGSRAMQRLVSLNTGAAGWIVVQPGQYRYLASAGSSVIVRMVIGEYLGCEVIWA